VLVDAGVGAHRPRPRGLRPDRLLRPRDRPAHRARVDPGDALRRRAPLRPLRRGRPVPPPASPAARAARTSSRLIDCPSRSSCRRLRSGGCGDRPSRGRSACVRGTRTSSRPGGCPRASSPWVWRNPGFAALLGSLQAAFVISLDLRHRLRSPPRRGWSEPAGRCGRRSRPCCWPY